MFFVNNQKFGQKSMFLFKIENSVKIDASVKNRKFGKNRKFDQNRKFHQNSKTRSKLNVFLLKIKNLFKNRNFLNIF